jgi:hypothetical protein
MFHTSPFLVVLLYYLNMITDKFTASNSNSFSHPAIEWHRTANSSFLVDFSTRIILQCPSRQDSFVEISPQHFNHESTPWKLDHIDETNG